RWAAAVAAGDRGQQQRQQRVRGATGRPPTGADPGWRTAAAPREGPRGQGLRPSPLPRLPGPPGDQGAHRPLWGRLVDQAWPPPVEGGTLDRLAGRLPAAADPL